MNNRFSALSDKKVQDKERHNNFQQRPNQKNHRDCKSQFTRSTHGYPAKKNKNKFSQPKTPEFKLEDENFPTLSTNISELEKCTLSYSEKIKQQEEIEEVESSLPKGYIKLTYKDLAERAAKPKTIKEPISEYYNPYGAYLIMEDRRKHREELNDILGDMSPYWDMPTLSDDEYEEEEYNEYPDEYSEEEYVEDW